MPTLTVSGGKLRSAARAGGFALWTLSAVGLARLHQRAAKAETRYEIWQRWMKAWTRGLLVLFGVEQVITPKTGAPPSRGARLVVSNHRSPLDIALLLWHFGGHVVSRDDLAHWPVIGIAARKAGTIFVDRDNAYSGLSAIRQIRQRLREGRTVIVFAEGGTSRGDQVRDFHAGVFGAVKRLDVEIIPVGIAYPPGSEFYDEDFAQHFARMAPRPKNPVSICFGNARPARGSPKEIAAEMQRQVQALVNQARAAL